MKITKLETIHVRPRWLFLKVHTDTDIFGLGEPCLEGRSLTVETAVHEIGRWLIGQDPRRIEHIWQNIYRGGFYRGGPILTSALSGIEQALWDILGKHLKVPVYQLLGGWVRDKIRMYGWIDAEKTGDYIEQSKKDINKKEFTAYKMTPVGPMKMIESPESLDKVIDTIKKIRELIGRDVDLALDFHGRTTPAMAKKLIKRLEQYEPMFIEEPVLPGNIEALKELSRCTTIPIAAGERLFTRWQFEEIISKQAVSIIQPDLSHAGGIFETRKIAAMAELKDIALAPHCPLGPIALASCLQIDACTPNFLCQEHLTLGEDYLRTPFKVENGYITVPDAPGLGIELDEEKVKAGTFDGKWDNPRFSLEDGSFTEW
jgi:galactonate dehydratase